MSTSYLQVNIYLFWPGHQNCGHPTQGATGAFLGTNILVCGGIPAYDNADECHIITPKSTEFLSNMTSKRYESSSLVIREKYLWISGGNNGKVTLSSTEFVGIEPTVHEGAFY